MHLSAKSVEDMESNAPAEERILLELKDLRWCLHVWTAPTEFERKQVEEIVAGIEAYLKQSIADRDMDYERDMDEDPFADTDNE